VLARWFVLTMLVLVPVALGVTLWAWTAIDRTTIDPAARRPPGGAEVTVVRGDAVLAETRTTEAGPDCATRALIVGDDGSRAAARRALGATCQLLRSGRLPLAAAGLETWLAAGGRLRLATFELSGVESSARVEDGAIVIELNAKFAFEDATRAAPAIVHQLGLIADPDWPGATVAASTALAASREQALACERLVLREGPPRGCLDVDELLALDDPLAALVAVGWADRG
jgi:hypothetical protein